MENLIALVALTSMEVVLGIDNIVFLAIVTAKLPEHQRPLARKIGLVLAMLMRIGLLFCISLLMELKEPLFHLTSLGIPESLLQNMEHHEEVGAVSPIDRIGAVDQANDAAVRILSGRGSAYVVTERDAVCAPGIVDNLVEYIRSIQR